MEIYNTQIKNKHIKNMTCPKSVAIEPELYYKITLMYKCCWYWTNQCPINNSAGKQWNWNNHLFKMSQHTAIAKKTESVTYVLLTWNKSVSVKKTRQETNNQNSDLFKVVANALGLGNKITLMTYVLLTRNKSPSH